MKFTSKIAQALLLGTSALMGWTALGSSAHAFPTTTNLDGWEIYGTGSSSYTVTSPIDGYTYGFDPDNSFFLSNNNSLSPGVVANFLGVSLDSLRNLSIPSYIDGVTTSRVLFDDPENGIAGSGSAARKVVSAQAGDILAFNWTFDGLLENIYNDFSVLTIQKVGSTDIQILADIFSADYGIGPNQNASNLLNYTFSQGGDYRIGLAVFNSATRINITSLTVENVTLESDVKAPEPTATLALIGVGTLGSLLLKRKSNI